MGVEFVSIVFGSNPRALVYWKMEVMEFPRQFTGNYDRLKSVDQIQKGFASAANNGFSLSTRPVSTGRGSPYAQLAESNV